MFPELSEIKHIRKQLSLSQFELAKRAGVSQSMIAKIEAGRIDPTYTKARSIFEVLNSISQSTKIKANDLMNKKVVVARPGENIREVIKEMKKHSISQLPVFESGSIVGMVSETIILNALLEGKHNKVEEIMSDAPPIISKEADIEVLSGLLKYFSLVAVVDKGKFIGIITRADIIEKLKK